MAKLNLAKLSLPMNGNQVFKGSDFTGKKIVLYFYPKDMTPGCTQEGRDFSKLKNEFGRANALVFGISRDPVERHEKFIVKEKLSIDLLSDTEQKACDLFDVIKEKNMYGKKVKGIERSTFVFDENHNLVKEWRKVSVPGHAQEVLDFVKSLN